jgi:hypothetical protein
MEGLQAPFTKQRVSFHESEHHLVKTKLEWEEVKVKQPSGKRNQYKFLLMLGIRLALV